MDKFKYLCIIGALTAVLGCNRSSDSAAGGASDNQNTSTGRGESRSTDSAKYSAITNQPDNTGRNVRDRSDESVTPGDQSESDRETTRKIRRAITSNDQLSTDAKNIKIVTINGKVTLRGPVKSEDEHKTINSIVQQMGLTGVEDQLEVKAPTQQ